MMISSLNKSTKRLIFMVVGFYILAFVLSTHDLRGNESNLFCGIVTLILVLVCFYMAYRCGKLASKISKATFWSSQCCCQRSAAQVMLGFCCAMLVLGTLKAWSVGDVFVTYWGMMPSEYHARAWAYLAHNGMDVLLAGVVVRIFEAKYVCSQIPKIITKDGITFIRESK